MNLLENNITQIIIDNYDISVGYVSDIENTNVELLNDGIVTTISPTLSSIKRCSEIPAWVTDTIYVAGNFYRNDDKVYVCLYSTGESSIFAPTGNILSNIILDDNYVWRYMCDIQTIIYDDYVIPVIGPETIKHGCISGVNIIKNSEHQITSYASFNINEKYLSGTGLSYVVENDQDTLVAKEILIQNGGINYKQDDVVVITDTPQNILDAAIVEVDINEAGEVELVSFTNGQNYNYVDIFIIGNGTGAEVTFTTLAGVITNVNITGGSGYTWAQAIVVNSEVYMIGIPTIEPLNGYNADLIRHIGPNKYIIESKFMTDQEINFYGVHRKSDENKNVFFDNIYFVDPFTPLVTEEITLNIVLG